jgi:hypothetical protein
MKQVLAMLPAAVIAVVLGVASQARAETINLTTGGPAESSVSGTTVDGQPISRTWNNAGGVAGLTLTARAWQMASRPTTATGTNNPSFVSNAATAVTNAGLGRYSNGLGVSTGTESGTGNQHTVDNDGPLEFIEFTFSSAVQVTGMTVTNYSVGGDATDGDYTIAFADVSGGVLPTGTTYYNYAAGTTSFTTSFSSFFDVFATLRQDLGPDAYNDGFKIGSLTFTTTTVTTTSIVPLPQSAVMGLGLLAALGGFGVWRRRRRSADMA